MSWIEVVATFCFGRMIHTNSQGILWGDIIHFKIKYIKISWETSYIQQRINQIHKTYFVEFKIKHSILNLLAV